MKELSILDWGFEDYETSLSRQKTLLQERIADSRGDSLALVEHPPVVTIGKSGSTEDFRVPEELLLEQGVGIRRVERGGKTTFHGPGQLVAYPIVKLEEEDLHAYVEGLLRSVEDVLMEFGLAPERRNGQPGVWVNGSKVASVGIAVRKWVTFHGISLNVSTDLEWFRFISPCGQPNETMTSMERELAAPLRMSDVKKRFVAAFSRRFGYRWPEEDTNVIRKPAWLHLPAVRESDIRKVEQELSCQQLDTVCNSARCPNLGECFSKGTATFMILGTVCTRRCRFCAVEKGVPYPVDGTEPRRLTAAVKSMGLKYVVVTSVTRDDLPDGGAAHFAETITRIQKECPAAKVEVLVPDFKGDSMALNKVCRAQPDMFSHNLETVQRLYPMIGRLKNNYLRSLSVLHNAAGSGLPVKSGLMLGLGETRNEIRQALVDLREAGCRYLTLGQYLAPSSAHVPVVRYVLPDEFQEWREISLSFGFVEVAAGPLVRSSYRAEEMLETLPGSKQAINH
jgi:lipoic acid synthetase